MISSQSLSESEVEWCSLDGSKDSGWNACGIDRRKTIRRDHHLMVKDVSFSFTGQIEITMVSQVDHGWFVCRRKIVHDEFILIVQRICDGDLDDPRVAFLSIRTLAPENHTGCIGIFERLTLPDNLVETFPTTVEVIGRIVGCS